MNAVTGEQFWTIFDAIKMDKDRLTFMELMKDNGFPFQMVLNPVVLENDIPEPSELSLGDMLQTFCVSPYSLPELMDQEDIRCNHEGSSPDKVAEVFTKCFGEEIICPEESYYMNKKQTIINCLDRMCDGEADSLEVDQLITAFEKLGHKRA